MKIVIFAGSESDSWFTEKLEKFAAAEKIATEIFFGSAHKMPAKILENVQKFANEKVVFVTVAGRSNALSGVIAANTKKPVLACPPFRDKTDFLVNINSTLQMPSKTPVLTILDPQNAILAAKKILEL